MTTQDLINTIKQGKPMTDKLMREIVRELEEKTEQLHTMGTAMRAKDADHVALLARHNALVEAIHKAMGRTTDCDKKQTDNQLIADVAYLKRIASDYFKSSHEWRCLAFTAKQKYNALREAVEWERECSEVIWPAYRSSAYMELIGTKDAARAEVDRLIANAADCEGEG